MSFADQYLEKQLFREVPFQNAPHDDLNLVVMIPCFNEPDVLSSLQSLWDADRPECAVEIIIIVNESEHSEATILAQNKKSLVEIKQFIALHQDDNFRFHCFHAEALPKKHAGVGLARKIGMDAAVSRFNQLDRPEGIILSFDADARVAVNYFTVIEEQYKSEPETMACVLNYLHPTEGNEFDCSVYNGIIQYELYLRYYYQALKLAGHPHSYHTVGSSFNVKASVYCKQGGMNRRQAGEDFYFLQKIIPLAKVKELNQTSVYPSPRGSDRVPFGTGATINQLLFNKQDIYLTYDLNSFQDVKKIIDDIPLLFELNFPDLNNRISTYPESMQQFLLQNKLSDNLEEIKWNSSGLQSFTKRFYTWFNAFKVLKYLNFAHEGFYQRKPIADMAQQLLSSMAYPEIPDNNKQLLAIFRSMEK